jgi:transcriptional regulator with XRE-family HTH domain
MRPLKPKEIRVLRLREGASQAVFARYLNVTTGLVSQWERGEKHPHGASLKLLTLVYRFLNSIAIPQVVRYPIAIPPLGGHWRCPLSVDARSCI